MKKLLLLFILSIGFTAQIQAQNKKSVAKIKEIEGQYEIGENGDLVYEKIVEVPEASKDQLYDRAMSYFVFNYGSANDVIQAKDKDQGYIIGKGIYSGTGVGSTVGVVYSVNSVHILRIDTKEGRARISLNVTGYDLTVDAGAQGRSNRSSTIAENYPINPKGGIKNVMAEAFYNSHINSIITLDQVEKALKGEEVTSSPKSDDWQ